MPEINNFSQIVDHLRGLNQTKRVAVVCPYDEETLSAVVAATDKHLITPILIGELSRIQQIATQVEPSALSYEIIATDSPDEAALKAVEMTRNGQADIVMKGLVNTDNLLRAILNKEHAILPKGKLLTHLSVAQLPGYNKLLFFSDVAVIPYPTLEQRIEMINYNLDTCRKFGVVAPKVALIHFTEKVNPKFQNSVDYATLVEMCNNGEFGNASIAGPMDVKTACDAHSAEVKGLSSDVCGNADLLIFPNIESGNTFYKTITLFGNAKIAGILQGTSSPVILSSRSDSADSKFYSLVLACVNAM